MQGGNLTINGNLIANGGTPVTENLGNISHRRRRHHHPQRGRHRRA